MDRELTNDMINRANRAITAFNARNQDDFDRAIASLLELANHPDVGYRYRIDLLGEVRSLASLLQDRDNLSAIDHAIYQYLGPGINHFNADFDVELRQRANDAIAALNAGNRPAATEVLKGIVAFCNEGPGVIANHHDVLDALCNVAEALGDAELIKTIQGIDGLVLAQKALLDANRVSMPLVEFDAIDYPYVVTVETFMKCNAKCHFCPYPEMEENSDRAGVRLPTALFEKLIDDLCDIPSWHRFQMNLSRVNEPLLDSRLFDFLDLIEKRLPNVTVFMPSNGSTLTEKNVQKLMALNNFEKLMVSLNAADADTYAKVMDLPFDRTIANLDRMHEIEADQGLGFNVVLTAVLPSGEEYEKFKDFCTERYPKFYVDRYAPTDWFGRTDNEAKSEHFSTVSCKDYYQLHILADGREAQCCFDSEGAFGEGNIKDQHALDIYNKDWQRKLRRHAAFRGSDFAPDYCHNCNHG